MSTPRFIGLELPGGLRSGDFYVKTYCRLSDEQEFIEDMALEYGGKFAISVDTDTGGQTVYLGFPSEAGRDDFIIAMEDGEYYRVERVD